MPGSHDNTGRLRTCITCDTLSLPTATCLNGRCFLAYFMLAMKMHVLRLGWTISASLVSENVRVACLALVNGPIMLFGIDKKSVGEYDIKVFKDVLLMGYDLSWREVRMLLDLRCWMYPRKVNGERFWVDIRISIVGNDLREFGGIFVISSHSSRELQMLMEIMGSWLWIRIVACSISVFIYFITWSRFLDAIRSFILVAD